MRWYLHLAEYTFQVQNIKELHNVYADRLSRLRTNTETTSDDWDEVPSVHIHTLSDSPDKLLPK